MLTNLSDAETDLEKGQISAAIGTLFGIQLPLISLSTATISLSLSFPSGYGGFGGFNIDGSTWDTYAPIPTVIIIPLPDDSVDELNSGGG